MKQVHATYEHSTIGFPAIKLKWSVRNQYDFEGFYITIHGIIQKYPPWRFRNENPLARINDELKAFDLWVGQTYGDDILMQG